MNSNARGGGIVVIGFGLLAGIMVLLSILMAGGNVLGQFFKYLLIGLFIFGFILPRVGLFTLIAACGYFDFMKRVLVVADRVSYNDLLYVLGCPPVLLGGVLLGLCSQFLQGRIPLRPWNGFCILLIPIIGAASFAINMQGSTVKDALIDTVNGSFYSVLLLIVPVLMPTGEALRKLLRFTLWAYLPVALYGVWQKVFGLMEFEIAYLKTGMSILIGQLIMGEIRPFSTLNSPTALGALCAAFAAMCFLMKWNTPPVQGRKQGVFMMWVLALCYIGGLLATTSRSDAITLIVGLVAAPLFMSPQGTRAIYAVWFVSFITLILTSGSILENIEQLQYKLWAITGVGGDFSEQLTRLGTYSDRLMGFTALVNDGRVWTLFGASEQVRASIYLHDPLTAMLLKVGIVPLGLLMIIFAALLRKMHRQVWMIEDIYDRRLACLCLSVALGFVASSVLSGGRISVFPVGLHFWMLLSVVATLAWGSPVVEEEESEQEVPLPVTPAGGAGRFRPVPRATSGS